MRTAALALLGVLAAASTVAPPDTPGSPITRADAAPAAARADTTGLFGDTVPADVSVAARGAAEVGTTFEARRATTVVAAQFYKAARGKRATPVRATLWNA
jgi:hypothetical protein